METRASYAIIGAFVLAGIGAMAAFIVWLGQVQFNRDYAEYHVVFEGAVNGLSEGGQVRYLGISVGEVIDLSLDPDDPNNVIAHIRIDAETPVRTDSKAILDFAGLTGVTFIQIQPGTPGANRLRRTAGSPPPVIETEQTQLAVIFESGEDLMANAQVTLANFNALFTENNVENISATLANIREVTGVLAEDEELLQEVTLALRSFADAGQSISDAADSFDTLSESAREDLQSITEGINGAISDARSTIQRLEQAIETVEADLGETTSAVRQPALEAVEEYRLLAQDMRLLMRRMDRIAREIEQNPQAFIQGSPRPYREE